MLRRKLLLNLGPLVTLLLISAVASIWLLQRVLMRLDQETVVVAQTSAHIETHQEHAANVRALRQIVILVGVVFVVVINVSVIILLRIAGMIVRPVDKLVETTRALSEGHFGARVELDERDEFDDLGRAYNSLAERLQAGEARRIEVLGQVALVMNHEINNAIAIIDLQLRLMKRRAPEDPQSARHLEQIQQSLQRMTDTVAALKSARRIVLTDYTPGVKMLDLARSQQTDDEPPTDPQPAAAAAAIARVN